MVPRRTEPTTAEDAAAVVVAFATYLSNGGESILLSPSHLAPTYWHLRRLLRTAGQR